MKLAIWLSRLIVGATFLVSGTAKMIDPIGSLIKIEAYLAAWNLDEVIPRGLALLGGCALSMIEFLTGLLIFTGSLRRTAALSATAIMAVMLPLTAYIAIADPVDDCGCFGDMLTLSNTATFVKNLLLMVPTLFLLRYNGRCRGFFAPWSQWIQIAIGACYMLIVGVIGYHEQPLIDFRAYPVGEPLTDHAGAGMSYVYRAPDGSMHEFTEDDSLPDESDGWEYVEARETAPASGKMLALFDRETGLEVTDEVIGTKAVQMLLLIPEPSAATAAGSFTANELCAAMEARYGRGAFVAVTDARPEAVDAALDLMMAEYPVYYADPKAIKAVARGDMAAVCLRNDTVCWKRTLSSINLDLLERPDADITADYATNGSRLFLNLTLLFIAAEAVLSLISMLPTLRFRTGKSRPRTSRS